MICPKCKRDLTDVPREKLPGYVYETDDSFGLPFIRRGRACTNCGFIFETEETATGEPYHKRGPRELPGQTRMEL
ncbi:MAG: hypothetical protein EPO24_07700 [Bacteroidetes bacterium]|nr:MAG: hypothetical protein EPO24_07700 [Bacteroidota bacterium]